MSELNYTDEQLSDTLEDPQARIRMLEASVTHLRANAELWHQYRDKIIRQLAEAQQQNDILRAGLQRIVRECRALNKGPAAVHIALKVFEALRSENDR